jgi:hypothetical protein
MTPLSMDHCVERQVLDRWRSWWIQLATIHASIGSMHRAPRSFKRNPVRYAEHHSITK